jgi:hypothetical protein
MTKKTAVTSLYVARAAAREAYQLATLGFLKAALDEVHTSLDTRIAIVRTASCYADDYRLCLLEGAETLGQFADARDAELAWNAMYDAANRYRLAMQGGR